MLTQEEAARVMYAAERYAARAITFAIAQRCGSYSEQKCLERFDKARRAFADLVAELTEPEGV